MADDKAKNELNESGQTIRQDQSRQKNLASLGEYGARRTDASAASSGADRQQLPGSETIQPDSTLPEVPPVGGGDGSGNGSGNGEQAGDEKRLIQDMQKDKKELEDDAISDSTPEMLIKKFKGKTSGDIPKTE